MIKSAPSCQKEKFGSRYLIKIFFFILLSGLLVPIESARANLVSDPVTESATSGLLLFEILTIWPQLMAIDTKLAQINQRMDTYANEFQGVMESVGNASGANGETTAERVTGRTAYVENTDTQNLCPFKQSSDAHRVLQKMNKTLAGAMTRNAIGAISTPDKKVAKLKWLISAGFVKCTPSQNVPSGGTGPTYADEADMNQKAGCPSGQGTDWDDSPGLDLPDQIKMPDNFVVPPNNTDPFLSLKTPSGDDEHSFYAAYAYCLMQAHPKPPARRISPNGPTADDIIGIYDRYVESMMNNGKSAAEACFAELVDHLQIPATATALPIYQDMHKAQATQCVADKNANRIDQGASDDCQTNGRSPYQARMDHAGGNGSVAQLAVGDVTLDRNRAEQERRRRQELEDQAESSKLVRNSLAKMIGSFQQ